MIDLNRYVDPYGPARDFLPEDAWEASPSDDEEGIWAEACSAFIAAKLWWPDQGPRVVWYAGSDPRWRGRTYGTSPPV